MSLIESGGEPERMDVDPIAQQEKPKTPLGYGREVLVKIARLDPQPGMFQPPPNPPAPVQPPPPMTRERSLGSIASSTPPSPTFQPAPFFSSTPAPPQPVSGGSGGSGASLTYVPYEINPGFANLIAAINSAWIQEIRVNVPANAANDSFKFNLESLFNNMYDAIYIPSESTYRLVTKKKKDSDEGALLLVRSGVLLGPLNPGAGGGSVVSGGGGAPIQPVMYTAKQKLIKRKEYEREISQDHVRRAFRMIEKDRKTIVDILTYFAAAAKKPRDQLLNVSSDEFGDSFKSYLVSYNLNLTPNPELQREIDEDPMLDDADRLVLQAAYAHPSVTELQNITEFFQRYSPEVFSAFATFWPKLQLVCDKRRLDSNYWDVELKESRIVVFICNCASEVTFVNGGASRAQTKIQESSSAALSRSNWFQLGNIAYELGWRKERPVYRR